MFFENKTRVQKLGIRGKEGYFSNVYELPEGAEQMYLRDPAQNLVGVNWPDVATLSRLVVEDIEKVPIEADEGARTMLYMR